MVNFVWQQLKDQYHDWRRQKSASRAGELLKGSLADIHWLAIDLELTGLNTKQDEIVSVGWLHGRGMSMQMSTCHHAFINTETSLQQSPVIHGITQDDLQQAADLTPQLQRLAGFAQSHVWVFHCHSLDWGILSRKYQELQLARPKPLIVDTLLLERYITSKGGGENSALDLTSCRSRYGFALAPAHNALDDACATLELLLAQLNHLGVRSKDPLKSLNHTGAIYRL